MNQRLLLIAGITVALGSAPGLSSAAIVSGSVDTGLVGPPAGNIELHIPKFDGGLGSLSGLTLTFHAEVTPSYEVSNGNFFDVEMGPVTWDTTLLLGPHTNFTEGCNGSPAACFTDITDSVGTFSVPAHTASHVISRPTQVRDDQAIILNAGELSQFVGLPADFFTFYFSARTFTSAQPGAPAATPLPTADYRASIGYSYTYDSVAAVPLPAALPLVMAGLGFLGFFGRREHIEGKPPQK